MMMRIKQVILMYQQTVLRYALMAMMLVLICLVIHPAWAQMIAPNVKLIVVRDAGGEHTLPYYQDYGLTNDLDHPLDKEESFAPKAFPTPSVSVSKTEMVTDAAMLPVRSQRMKPGAVEPRTIHAPGLRAVFLIGDDDLSKRWLVERLSELKALHAVGLVVNAENMQALEELRRLAPGLMLSPVSGDDISIRLDLLHYPVLITFDSIVQ
ncbi:MAG: integrating conjugative element protein [Saezia sp.]